MKHFEDKFIFDGKGKQKKLKWSLNLVPSIHSRAAIEKPSTLPTTSTRRKPPKIFQEDESSKFMKVDVILSFDELHSNYCPSGFQTYKTDNYILYYNFVYNENTGFPSIKETIKIDFELYVLLQICAV